MKKINLSNYNTLLFFILRAPFVGIASKNLLFISKQDTWISIIIAIILGFIPLNIYYKIITKYPSKNILEIIYTLFGKTLGTIINIILCSFILFFAGICFGNLINFIGSQYLYKTPDLAIMIIFAIALFYVLKQGINSIFKTSTIIFYIAITFYLLSTLGLFMQINISNIYPILEHGPINILKGTYNYFAYNIIPVFILTIIPYNKINNNDKFVKNFILFYIVSSLSMFIVSFYTISIYGINLANLVQYPEFHLLKRLTIIGSLQRFENILSIQWIFDIFFYTALSCYYMENLLIKLTKQISLKKTIIKYIIDIIIVLIITYLSTSLFKNDTKGTNFIIYILPTLSFIFFFIVPIIIYITSKTKRIMNNS